VPSLFRRVGRYVPSGLLDPRENRLTEAFASVLERVDRLPARLVADWCGVSAPAQAASIRTQRRTASGGFVDLELRFAGDAPLLVWVEVKHGADLHEQQIESYASDILAEALGERHLVLLAPRQSMPQSTQGATPVEWQRVARLLQSLERDKSLHDVERFLVREFCRYLKEEGLADEEALTAATAFALAARPTAERTLARLLEIVDGYVPAAWGEPTNFLKEGRRIAAQLRIVVVGELPDRRTRRGRVSFMGKEHVRVGLPFRCAAGRQPGRIRIPRRRDVPRGQE
jgi:hypothetical protein